MKIQTLHPTRNRIPTTPNFAVDPADFAPEHIAYGKEFGRVKFRPIRPDDEKRMIAFHETLSEESVFLRYFEHISLDTRTLHERLKRVCANTPDSYAIVAETCETSRRPAEILGVGRLTTTENPLVAAFAVLLGDTLQDTHVPGELLKRLIQIARAQKFLTLTGELLVGDHDTLACCRALGFRFETLVEDGVVRVTYDL